MFLSRNFRSLCLGGIAALAFASCGDSDGDNNDNTDNTTPSVVAYEFDSRFVDGESSVYNGGQLFRQVLISGIKSYLGDLDDGIDSNTLNAEQIVAKLNGFYDYDETISSDAISFSVGDVSAKQTTYGAMDSTSKLSNKIAGKDATGQTLSWEEGALVGWTSSSECDGSANTCVKSPHELVQEWFTAVATAAAARSTDGTVVYDPSVAEADRTDNDILPVYVTADGLDYKQLLQKFLLGAVNFSQGADDYLDDDLDGKGLNCSNAQDEDETYSALEHAWDEGYGYFGASRYYGLNTDAENKAGGKDHDGDGKIDLLTEYNFGHSVNAAKRDIGADASAATDFTADAYNAFYEGRKIIAEAGETLSADEMTALKAQRDIAVSAWEKAIASTVVHYINDVLTDMGNFDTADYVYTDHAKHWGELKGFAMSFQFNPRSPMMAAGTTHFADFHTKVGQAPVLSTASATEISAYETALKDARGILKTAYGFADANVTGW